MNGHEAERRIAAAPCGLGQIAPRLTEGTLFDLHTFAKHALDPALQVLFMMQPRQERRALGQIAGQLDSLLKSTDVHGRIPLSFVVGVPDDFFIDFTRRPVSPTKSRYFGCGSLLLCLGHIGQPVIILTILRGFIEK